MLKKLTIKNLILVDFAEITFSNGLNILTGESGAGKSAILSAISLVIGRKASPELIRETEQIAWSEAVFNVKEKDAIKEILDEEGIDFSQDTIRIRREISRTGKSRCFVEDQVASMAALKKIGKILIQIADQNSHEELGSEPYQRAILDQYALISSEVLQFSRNFQKEKQLEESIQNLTLQKEQKKLLKEKYSEELQEIQESALKEGEEESLSEEHHLLLHSQEIREKTESIYGSLKDPLLPRLSKIEQIFHSLVEIHPRFKECSELVKSARIELDEASHLLSQMRGSFDWDPHKLAQIEERIGVIESLKKKHGANFLAIEEKRKKLAEILNGFESDDETLEQSVQTLAALKKENEKTALSISRTRKKAASDLEGKILNELSSLNLPNARFAIAVKESETTSSGSDHIVFLFSANAGEGLKPLGNVASGGEMSRLLLAFQTALAEKAGAQTLLFDEIDANVGGKTAAMIGEKLSFLSKYTQILSVTHFVQVAQFASSHFLVKKLVTAGRTVTSIEKLDLDAKEAEYKRMVGK